jgi:hypothetical protein
MRNAKLLFGLWFVFPLLPFAICLLPFAFLGRVLGSNMIEQAIVKRFKNFGNKLKRAVSKQTTAREAREQ